MSVALYAYAIAAVLGALGLLMIFVRPRSRPPIVLPPSHYQGMMVLIAGLIWLAIIGARVATELALAQGVMFVLASVPFFLKARVIRIYGAEDAGVRALLAKTPELKGYKTRQRTRSITEVLPGPGEREWIRALLAKHVRELPRVPVESLRARRRAPGIIALVAAALTAYLGYYYSTAGKFRVREGEPMPSLSLVTLDGRAVTTDELRGKVAIINFFATWCGPCVTELATFEGELWPVIKDDPQFALVTIAVEENAELVRNYLKTDPHDWPFWIDESGRAFSEIANGGIPKTLILDREGRIQFKHAGWGPHLTKQVLEEAQSLTK